jgi:ribonuclease BN (tRNA processing enzyme)
MCLSFSLSLFSLSLSTVELVKAAASAAAATAAQLLLTHYTAVSVLVAARTHCASCLDCAAAVCSATVAVTVDLAVLQLRTCA